MPDNNLALVHDHYKETFSLQREREQTRDRAFLLLIGLFALLAVEVYYPAAAGTLRSFSVLGTDFDLSHLPLNVLLNASWVLTLAVALSYCRVAILIERQYPYVHHLEEWIGGQIGDSSLFQREGTAYLDRYPVLLNWAWFCYVIVFPLAVVLVAVLLVEREWTGLAYSIPHKTFDASIALCVVISFLLYRVVPKVADKFFRQASQ